MNNKRIKKCRICDEPYCSYLSETDDGVCPDCEKKAKNKNQTI